MYMNSLLPFAAFVCVCLFACKQKDYSKFTHDPILYCKTVKKLNDVVLYNNFSPVVASRNYAYANIAAYECIAAGDKNYQTLVGQIKHLPAMPTPADHDKIDYQLAALLAFVKVGNAVTFPEGVLTDYYNELKERSDSAGMPSEVLKNTVLFSDTVVSTILKWSKGDNYAKTRSAEKYDVREEDGRWLPTPPAYAQGLEPHWCDIRTLLLDSANQFAPPVLGRYNMKDSTSTYYKEAMEVKHAVENLTAEQKHMVDFFDDNPYNLHVTGHVMYATKKFSPPGHWMNIVGIAAEKSKADFNTTVAAYTETSIALFDGFISCWKAKYTHNSVRPETVINKVLDPKWQPYIQTPPFPSYVSGHAVISAASAEVMTKYFGNNFAYTDTSELEFGIPNRSFKSFREESLEASWSRLYGGIHFRCDLEQGNIMGKQIGEYVVGKLRLKRTPNQLSFNTKKS
jgi:hypothetical protein